MIGEWSEWVKVANWLDGGWNANPEAPYEKGVYRFRVTTGIPRAGEVLYIGRAGTQGEKINHSICARLANFITAAMGFWTHSGGETFYRGAADDDKEMAGRHHLSVRDLEVSWAVDDDPECRELEEFRLINPKPMFNKQEPRTCRSDTCERARNLLK